MVSQLSVTVRNGIHILLKGHVAFTRIGFISIDPDTKILLSCKWSCRNFAN